jgi:3-deoxy-D-manno-octulosonate 8-phosphate phosphatase KdsC-like HAD superfamily phosphatase
MNLHELLLERASNIKEVWLDVDGVMTHQKPVVIFELLGAGGGVIGFERHDGFLRTPLVPLDALGNPVVNRVELFSAKVGRPIAEGYGFDTRDGKVVEYLRENGLSVYFISGRNSPVVHDRALALGAVPILGEKDKLTRIKQTARCALGEILFVGDGIQDAETLSAVREAGGIAIAPADSCEEAIAASCCVTAAKGGEGVLYEIFSAFLKIRGLWRDVPA